MDARLEVVDSSDCGSCIRTLEQSCGDLSGIRGCTLRSMDTPVYVHHAFCDPCCEVVTVRERRLTGSIICAISELGVGVYDSHGPGSVTTGRYALWTPTLSANSEMPDVRQRVKDLS